MGNVKVGKVKVMTSAPEIFVKTWLGRKKHAKLIHMCNVYMLLYLIYKYIYGYIYIVARHKRGVLLHLSRYIS